MNRPVLRTLRRVIGTSRRLVSGLGFDASPGSLLLVTAGGDWAVKQIALAVQERLREHFDSVQILDDVNQRPYVTQANIHCLCRPAFFGSEGIPPVHRSNRIVVSWLHGGKDSLDRHVAAACQHLERHWRKVRRFIVPNSITRAKLLECGVDPAITHQIPNGVDLRVFRPATDPGERDRIRRELGLPLEAFVIGSFQRDEDNQGRPKLIKGPDTLVETLATVHARRPIVALLTGPGRTYVQRELTARGIPFLYHWLDHARDLVGMYHAIDAYLITSREEGGPTALRESLATGVPVVSTRMGLAVDLIDHGRNGWIADVGDVDGLARGLLTLIERPSVRQAFAHAGLETIRPLDFSIIAARYRDEVYRLAFRGPRVARLAPSGAAAERS